MTVISRPAVTGREGFEHLTSVGFIEAENTRLFKKVCRSIQLIENYSM